MSPQDRGRRYEPYPGQKCGSCRKAMQAAGIGEIYSGVSGEDLVVICACPHCGSETEVLMRPSGPS